MVLESLTKMERDALLIHYLFIIICLIVLIIPIDNVIGIKLFMLVIIYNVTIALVGIWRKHEEWVNLWLFAFILSLFQVFPDWYLAVQLETLAFPEDGLFKIGPVSGYMAGLWAIPIFMILFIGQRFQERKTRSIAYIIVALMSLLVFGMSELTMWSLGSWNAQNVKVMVDHLAVYIIIPEIILGLSMYYLYERVKEKSHWMKIPTAFIVMLLYIGSVSFFYFLIERLIFPS